VVGDSNRILGYFIEEAKEHLETIEKGLLNLKSIVNDSEQMNELFRAAHSVKGGAAMLGYSSIQKTSHRLEDAFKMLKESPDAPIDQELESLFLKGYDTLQDLIERLQGPFGLREEEGEEVMAQANPHFEKLLSYLAQLTSQETTASSQLAPATEAATKPAPQAQPPDIATQARKILQMMLQLFKQQATPESRRKLKILGDRLIKLAPQAKQWQILVRTAQKAILNPKHSYAVLAPVVIQELKYGSDLLHLGKTDEIAASLYLKRLAAAKAPQVLIPVEPKAAAKGLKNAFNKQQLAQIVELLQTAP
jgi:chemotaxis protein histidine kinase CheA